MEPQLTNSEEARHLLTKLNDLRDKSADPFFDSVQITQEQVSLMTDICNLILGE